MLSTFLCIFLCAFEWLLESYGSWIYNYLCNQCLSTLTLWVWILLRRGVLNTTLCDKFCLWLERDRLFFPGPPVSSTNKTDRHIIIEILLKVALNTITITLNLVCIWLCNRKTFEHKFLLPFLVLYNLLVGENRKKTISFLPAYLPYCLLPKAMWAFAITWPPSSVNFSHFNLLLLNRLAKWTETW